MLNEKLTILLEHINNITPFGDYVILNIEDIDKITNQKESQELLRNLKNLGYIKIKYDDGKRFCIGVTTSGKNYFEGVKNSLKLIDDINVKFTENSQKSQVFYDSFEKSIKGFLGWLFFSSFIGAVVGGFFVTFIILTFRG